MLLGCLIYSPVRYSGKTGLVPLIMSWKALLLLSLLGILWPHIVAWRALCVGCSNWLQYDPVKTHYLPAGDICCGFLWYRAMTVLGTACGLRCVQAAVFTAVAWRYSGILHIAQTIEAILAAHLEFCACMPKHIKSKSHATARSLVSCTSQGRSTVCCSISGSPDLT